MSYMLTIALLIIIRALEEERAANMNTVMGNMMQQYKEQKIAHMKNLKRMQLEHETISKKQVTTKEKADTTKVKIMESMKNYEELQGKYNKLKDSETVDKQAIAALTDDMASLLSSIEVDRQQWTALKESLKGYRKKLEQIAEQITDEQGKIVATKGVLDENDKLRTRIQNEERQKAKELIETELGAVRAQLNQEREQIKDSVEAEVKIEIDTLRNEASTLKAELEIAQRDKRELEHRLDAVQAYSDELENRLSGAQADHEAAAAELETQAKELEEKAELHRQLAIAQQKIEDLIAEKAGNTGSHRDVEAEKYLMFKTMMNAFEDERKVMEKSYRDLQSLLSQATRDVIYLSQQNEQLSAQLTRVIHYEPPIQPSRGLAHIPNFGETGNGKPPGPPRIFADLTSDDGGNRNSADQNGALTTTIKSINGSAEPLHNGSSLPPLQVNGVQNGAAFTATPKKKSPLKSPKHAKFVTTKGSSKFKFDDDLVEE